MAAAASALIGRARGGHNELRPWITPHSPWWPTRSANHRNGAETEKLRLKNGVFPSENEFLGELCALRGTWWKNGRTSSLLWKLANFLNHSNFLSLGRTSFFPCRSNRSNFLEKYALFETDKARITLWKQVPMVLSRLLVDDGPGTSIKLNISRRKVVVIA